MDWFRWHHGSVTDPKFQLVAKKAGASVAEVIAVWATLLEAASMAEHRGNPGEVDFESIDCALGLSDGKAEAIYSHMAIRGVVAEDGRITAWEKRQPKREREDDNSTERVKAFRERQRQETPGNATETTETPRGDKRREEEKKTSLSVKPDESLFDRFYAAYPRKVGKDAARKAFAKRNPDEELLSTMVSAIQRQGLAAKCARGESQYVPHPATWLNEARWQDEDASNDDPYGLKKAINYGR